MKNFPLLFIAIFFCTNIIAQSSAGLVAHWDMNGTTNDVTGNGHDGHGNFITPTEGMTGMPNTAYYFNGLNSLITAPYMPDLNVVNYSICAKVKVIGYNSGICECNWIIARGMEMGSGRWSLIFDDNAFNACGVLDTTKQVFFGCAGNNSPASSADWQYLPGVESNAWSTVIMTFNGSQWKVYVNNVLVNTATSAAPSSIGTGTDSIVIGKNIWHPTFPYPFKGVIDDIRFYNRVLHDTEIAEYNDTCGTIIANPLSQTMTIGSSVHFTTTTAIEAPSYAWQADTNGVGFVDLSDGGPYSGTGSATLTVTGVNIAMHTDKFRCIVSNEVGCADTSTVALLGVTPVNVTELEQLAEVSISPNPATAWLSISMPLLNEPAQLQILDCAGRVLLDETLRQSVSEIGLLALNRGIYLVRITVKGKTVVRKLVKT